MIEDNQEIESELGSPDFSSVFENDDAELSEIAEFSHGESAPKQAGVGELVGVVAVFATNFLADRKGDHWRLKPEEAQALSQAVDDVMPEQELSPAWALGAVTVGIFAPRIMVDIQLQQALEEKEVSDSDEKESTT